MYRSKNNSPERNSKLSEKEMRKNEERRVKDDFLMSYGPAQICQSELKKIVVNIDGNSSPGESSEPPLQYDLGDPELFTVYRRPGEGSKPVFANVVVNQLPDFRRVSIRNSRSPDLISASEAIRSTRRPSSPAHTSRHHRDRSRSRSGSVHRRSPKPSGSSSHGRSPKRHRSRDSSNRSPRRSPNKRVNSPSRRISPRRYSPNRKYSPSRSSRRPSPSSRREYERDRERYRHHSDKGRDFSSRRSPDRRSSPRRHYSPPRRNELPVMTVPVDPSYHGFYPVPLPPEYWMGIAHATTPMFRPRLPPGFMPRPMRHPRIPDGFVPRAQHQHQNQQANKPVERPTPSSTVTSAQPSPSVTTTAEK